MTFSLSHCQSEAMNAFSKFYLDPHQTYFVLSGYSGTGKSTLTTHIVNSLDKLERTARLIDPNRKPLDVVLTATTNKAAENLGNITGREVRTIQSLLGLYVHTDFKSGKSQLRERNNTKQDRITDSIIFIDEYSYFDQDLYGYLTLKAIGCKVVFMGDPEQILSVGASHSVIKKYASMYGWSEAHLSEVVRTDKDNHITDLSTKFRNTVLTGEFFSFKPDGEQVVMLEREDFYKDIEKEFLRSDWKHNDSKVLAWRNKTAIWYNQAISNSIKGVTEFEVGDYAICNSYVAKGKVTIATDRTVLITNITPVIEHGLYGNQYELDHRNTFFMPNDWNAAKAQSAAYRAEGNYLGACEIDESWIDLRAAYSSTVNKSQGSTYGKVFIDLDDFKTCHNANQLARMLYVGVSRAKEQVILCGDIV